MYSNSFSYLSLISCDEILTFISSTGMRTDNTKKL